VFDERREPTKTSDRPKRNRVGPTSAYYLAWGCLDALIARRWEMRRAVPKKKGTKNRPAFLAADKYLGGLVREGPVGATKRQALVKDGGGGPLYFRLRTKKTHSCYRVEVQNIRCGVRKMVRIGLFRRRSAALAPAISTFGIRHRVKLILEAPAKGEGGDTRALDTADRETLQRGGKATDRTFLHMRTR